MDTCKKPSGAEFRKRKRDKEEKAKKMPKLDKCFKKTLAAVQSTSSVQSSQEDISISSSPVTEPVPEATIVDDEMNNTGYVKSSMEINQNQDVCIASSNKDNDIGRYPIGNVPDNDTIMHILSCEPRQPHGPFPKDPITKRSFSSDYYHVKTKTEQKLHKTITNYKLDFF